MTDPANVYVNGRRQCRACQRLYDAKARPARNAKKRETRHV